jgi:sugar/nucleoside kinase (ribokinase family)
MINVTSIGDVNVDILSEAVEKFEENNEQKIVEQIKLKVGGGAANFACWLRKLGMKVRLIGAVGNDMFGEFIKEELKKIGVDARLVTLKERTGITIGIQFKDGSKRLVTFRGTNRLLSFQHINVSEIDGDVVYFSGYNLLENLRKDLPKLFEKIKREGKVISLDPDLKAGITFEKSEFFEVAKYVDIMFLNEKEARLISNNFEWFKGRTLVIKRGRKGAVGIENGERVEVSGKEVEVKNPTGAGDVFNAAFIHHYYYGYELRECLEFANSEAAEYIQNF